MRAVAVLVLLTSFVSSGGCCCCIPSPAAPTDGQPKVDGNLPAPAVMFDPGPGAAAPQPDARIRPNAAAEKSPKQGGPGVDADIRVRGRILLRGERAGAKYWIEEQQGPERLRLCNLVFDRDPKSPEFVDQMLRDGIEAAIAEDASRDILAMAFVGDEVMRQNQHSGSLVYRAATKKIGLLDDERGIKKITADRDGYFVETREEKTLEGIKPERRWLGISIVFAAPPDPAVAYDAIRKEIGAAARRRLDIRVYAFAGDKARRTSWQQLRDVDGAFIFAEFRAASGSITRRGKSLGVIAVEANLIIGHDALSYFLELYGKPTKKGTVAAGKILKDSPAMFLTYGDKSVRVILRPIDPKRPVDGQTKWALSHFTSSVNGAKLTAELAAGRLAGRMTRNEEELTDPVEDGGLFGIPAPFRGAPTLKK